MASKMSRLIRRIEVPKHVRKFPYVTAETITIYDDHVESKNQQRNRFWYYKDYNSVDIQKAFGPCIYASIVFIDSNLGNTTGFIKSGAEVVQDSNRILVCSGMFSFAPANDFLAPIVDEIRLAMNTFKSAEKESSAPVLSTSPADEIKKFKELLDEGIITQEEFDLKKKQLLGL